MKHSHSEFDPEDVNPADALSAQFRPPDPDSQSVEGGLGPLVQDKSAGVGQREHLLNKLRVVIWGQHQSLVAFILFGCLVLMPAFFGYLWYVDGGLVNIDRAAASHAAYKVDINSAELGEIVVLPGVGRKLAQAISKYRQDNGGFVSLSELCEVPGIGEKKLESLRPYLLPISPGG